HITRHHDPSLHLFAVELVRSGCVDSTSQFAQRGLATRWRVDQNGLHRRRISPGGLVEPHDQIETPLTIENLPDRPALEGRLHPAGYVPRTQSIGKSLVTIQLKTDLRDLALRLDLQIDHTGDTG